MNLTCPGCGAGYRVDEGKIATRVMEDYSNNPDALVAALDQVDGSLEAGTPLWDSLAEMITRGPGSLFSCLDSDTVRCR